MQVKNKLSLFHTWIFVPFFSWAQKTFLIFNPPPQVVEHTLHSPVSHLEIYFREIYYVYLFKCIPSMYLSETKI